MSVGALITSAGEMRSLGQPAFISIQDKGQSSWHLSQPGLAFAATELSTYSTIVGCCRCDHSTCSDYVLEIGPWPVVLSRRHAVRVVSCTSRTDPNSLLSSMSAWGGGVLRSLKAATTLFRLLLNTQSDALQMSFHIKSESSLHLALQWARVPPEYNSTPP